MGSFGTGELILIFLVVLLVFGAKRIPEIARGLGKGIREFKNATTEIKSELKIEEPSHQQIHSPRTPVQGTMSRTEASQPESTGSAE